jgi:hypothetical protein
MAINFQGRRDLGVAAAYWFSPLVTLKRLRPSPCSG